MKDNFTQGMITNSLFKFAGLLMLSLLLQALYGAIDLAVIGQFCDSASISAVATGSQVMHALTIIISGLTMGATIIIAKSVGRKDHKTINDVVNSQIKLYFIVTAIIVLLVLIFSKQIVNIMQVPTEAIEQTIVYITICTSGMIFISAYNGISGIFRGMGNSKLPLIFVGVASVCNIILDYLFVAYFNMGVAGVAFATIISQAVSVLFSVYYIKKSDYNFEISWKKIISGVQVKKIWNLGFPIALQDFLICISFLIITAIVNSLGVIASASVGISEKLFIFLSLVATAFMSTLSTYVAQNMGANQHDRAMKGVKIATTISFSFGMIIFLLTFFKGDFLASIFVSDPDVIASAQMYLKSCSFEYLFLSITFCLLGYFNGMGKTKFVMIQGLFTSFIVRIPLSLYFAKLPNTNMFIIGMAVSISAFIALVIVGCYFIKVKNDYRGERLQVK
ncbi:MAG: MATE family efflux transporter [Erysipelotrichaceae bacterium]